MNRIVMLTTAIALLFGACVTRTSEQPLHPTAGYRLMPAGWSTLDTTGIEPAVESAKAR